MRKLICCLLVVFSGIAMAQEASSALKAARELAAIVKTGDTVWMVDKMYPDIRKTLAANLKGGDAELVAKYRKMGEELKKNGVTFESFTVSNPVGVFPVKNKTETIVILPTKLVLSSRLPNGKIQRSEQESFLYAVAKASDKDKWYFIGGTAYSLNEIRNFFYDFPLSAAKVLPPNRERLLP